MSLVCIAPPLARAYRLISANSQFLSNYPRWCARVFPVLWVDEHLY